MNQKRPRIITLPLGNVCSLSDIEPLSFTQPNLPDKVVVRVKDRGEALASLDDGWGKT